MEAVRRDCLRELEVALGNVVHPPGSDSYGMALASLVFSGARGRRPLGVVQPASAEDVASAMRIAGRHGCQVTVRGGSHSSLCVADGAVMLDLSARMNTATLAGEDVRVGGGATMGAMLQALAPGSRVVPVGVASSPGLGLALRGGVGYLTRRFGLTLDHLREVEIVVPSGERLSLSPESVGDEAELWWGARGAAPSFGVVTRATLCTHPLASVYIRRFVVEIAALPAYFVWAPSLPRDVNASLVLGPRGAEPGAPVLYLCAVYAGDDAAGIRRLEEKTSAFLAAARAAPVFESRGSLAYREIPPFDVPGLDGSLASEAPPGEPVLVYVKACFFRSALDKRAAMALAGAMGAAPTPLCRMDLQQLGGAMAAVGPTETAFWHRDAQWNWVVTGAWPASRDQRDEVTAWVRETVRALAADVSGTYVVEVKPGEPETEAELAAAYGKNLPRLRELKRRWDPGNVLGTYYPL